MLLLLLILSQVHLTYNLLQFMRIAAIAIDLLHRLFLHCKPILKSVQGWTIICIVQQFCHLIILLFVTRWLWPFRCHFHVFKLCLLEGSVWCISRIFVQLLLWLQTSQLVIISAGMLFWLFAEENVRGRCCGDIRRTDGGFAATATYFLISSMLVILRWLLLWLNKTLVTCVNWQNTTHLQ